MPLLKVSAGKATGGSVKVKRWRHGNVTWRISARRCYNWVRWTRIRRQRPQPNRHQWPPMLLPIQTICAKIRTVRINKAFFIIIKISVTYVQATYFYKNYTKPENPMNAMARIPAVTRAIGMPLNGLGTSFKSRCSRRPANSTRAIP